MSRRRTGVWVAAVALLILLPGAGTAVIASTALPVGAPSPLPSASGSTSPPPFVTPRPAQPGQEPPKDGSWPAAWPSFAAADRPKSFADLPGLDVSFQAPNTWTCTQRSRTSDATRYACTDATLGERFGGELLARDCPAPCDDRRRTQLRRSEEAWGLQWIRGGTYTVFAEAAQLDGGGRYGLVFVSVYRSVPEGPLDRELIFRMSSPPDRANDLRKVANSIRRDIGA